MTEVQIYEKDGLFHNLVKLSQIMNGRYAAISDGSDMNTNNVLSYLEANQNKYPVVVCTIPPSIVEPGYILTPGKEDFTFRLYFLCTTNYTGDNQVKSRDPGTGTSLHNERFDVSDMKNVALSFMKALQSIEQTTRGSIFYFAPKQPYKIQRIVNAGNDKVAGVAMQFVLKVTLDCDYTDIDISGTDIDTLITVPDHASHFH